MFQFPGSSAAFGHMTFFIHHVTKKLVKRLGTRLYSEVVSHSKGVKPAYCVVTVKGSCLYHGHYSWSHLY